MRASGLDAGGSLAPPPTLRNRPHNEGSLRHRLRCAQSDVGARLRARVPSARTAHHRPARWIILRQAVGQICDLRAAADRVDKPKPSPRHCAPRPGVGHPNAVQEPLAGHHPHPRRLCGAARSGGAEPAGRRAAAARPSRSARRDRRGDRRDLDPSDPRASLRTDRRGGAAVRRPAGWVGGVHLRFPAAADIRGGDDDRRPARSRRRRADPGARGDRHPRRRRDRRPRAVADLRAAAGRLPAARRGGLDHRSGRSHRHFPRRRRAGPTDPPRRGGIAAQRRVGDRRLYGSARHHRHRAPSRTSATARSRSSSPFSAAACSASSPGG